MKFFIVLSCLLVAALANENADVLRLESQQDVGSFKYAYELSNTAKADQQGNLNNDIWKVGGSHSHTSPEGEQVSVSYVADENGYQVLNASPALPTPPPIPEAILRAIEYINAHPSKDAQP